MKHSADSKSRNFGLNWTEMSPTMASSYDASLNKVGTNIIFSLFFQVFVFFLAGIERANIVCSKSV